jgi:hypothetical protein
LLPRWYCCCALTAAKRKNEKIVKGVHLANRIAKAIANKTEAKRQVLLQRETDLAFQQALLSKLQAKHATIRDNIAACGQDNPDWKAAMTAKLMAWTARLLDDDGFGDDVCIRGRSGLGGGAGSGAGSGGGSVGASGGGR